MNAESTVTLHNGHQMPVIGLGTWQLTGDQAVQSVSEALELGYRMIDTSGDYNNQQQIGEAINSSKVPREDIYLVTKVEEIDNAFEKTQSNLEELGMEYVDLMLIHRPPAGGVGEKLWESLIYARNENFIKDIGVSNYTIEQIRQLTEITGEAPTVNQIEWSPFGFSRDMYEFCQHNGIIIQAYSPLTRAKRLEEEILKRMADKYGKTPAQLLLRWNLQRQTVPLPKATSREHLKENIEIFEFQINEEDMQTLNECNEEYSSLASSPSYL